MAYTGLVKNYYGDNQLKEEYFEVDGKKEGPYKFYHENGELWMIGNYVNGELEGEFRKYDNEETCEIRNFKNGKYDGNYKIYHLYYNVKAPLDKIKLEFTYVNGKKKSETIWYEKNGHITKSHKYRQVSLSKPEGVYDNLRLSK